MEEWKSPDKRHVHLPGMARGTLHVWGIVLRRLVRKLHSYETENVDLHYKYRCQWGIVNLH
jgi:hypothetical protein